MQPSVNRTALSTPKFRILKIHRAETRPRNLGLRYEVSDIPRQRPGSWPLTSGNIGTSLSAGNPYEETPLAGCVSSLVRTRLHWKFPFITEFNREFREIWPSGTKIRARIALSIRCLLGFSLRWRTGNWPCTSGKLALPNGKSLAFPYGTYAGLFNGAYSGSANVISSFHVHAFFQGWRRLYRDS